ncbi:MAG: hydrogenase expression/formation protein HypE [Thermoprotei archaeon]|nr:MAG: hydrogenase expression/formation protein HypE [Thermoprotei archaeon]
MTSRIRLAHGGGGRETSEIIENIIKPRFKLKKIFDGIGLEELDDGASIPITEKLHGRHLVVTSDSYTVYPIFFPGGDIGKLAACGSINDLAVMGARPVAMLDTIVVEEGFPLEDFTRILDSFKRVLEEENVALLGGDFKVMPSGKLDRIVISTTGIGIAEKVITDIGLKAGDKILINGGIGEHGAAIMAAQAGLDVESSSLSSDVQPLTRIMQAAIKNGEVHAAKDLTRGGLASALNEFAIKNRVSIYVYEDKIPVKEEVLAYSEMLGVDPLVLACEGRVIVVAPPEDAERIVKIWKGMGFKQAEIIGEVTLERPGYVLLETLAGGIRIIEKPTGEIVPRIC